MEHGIHPSAIKVYRNKRIFYSIEEIKMKIWFSLISFNLLATLFAFQIPMEGIVVTLRTEWNNFSIFDLYKKYILNIMPFDLILDSYIHEIINFNFLITKLDFI